MTGDQREMKNERLFIEQNQTLRTFSAETVSVEATRTETDCYSSEEKKRKKKREKQKK